MKIHLTVGTIVPDKWCQVGELQNIERLRSPNFSTSAKAVRDAYRRYYNTNGSVPFHERMIS